MAEGRSGIRKETEGTVPWLSIIMPIYNGAATLGATLTSLEGQSDGVEIIAVDQGSADRSRELLEAAAARLPLRIIDNPEGSGWAENTNLGVGAATAPLLTMLHQDDVWRPGRARCLADMAAEAPDADLWLHAASLIDEKGRRIGRMAPPFGSRARMVDAKEALAALFVQNTVALPAAVIRREKLIETGGLNESLWYTADWDLWLRLARQGLYWDPSEEVGFRVHGNSQTVRGANDLDGFRDQLSAPGLRHQEYLPESVRTKAVRIASASNAVNIALAAALNGRGDHLLRAVWKVLLLGPWLWPDFWHNTQIAARLWPRLKLALAGGFRTAPVRKAQAEADH